MRKETLLTIASLGALAAVSVSAFSLDVRQQIWQRDDSKCETCGKKYSDGWQVECSHYDHDQSKPNYNEPSNGRLQCLSCHLDYTISLGDNYAAELIRTRMKNTFGGRTKEWRSKH